MSEREELEAALAAIEAKLAELEEGSETWVVTVFEKAIGVFRLAFFLQQREIYEGAIRCCEDVRKFLPSADLTYGESFVLQGDCLRFLAPLRGQQRTDLEEAITCCEAARKVLPSDHPNYSGSYVGQGDCLRLLAPLRSQQRTDLEEAIACYEAAREVLPSDHPNYGGSFLLQGLCLGILAQLRGQKRMDLVEAITCHEAARRVLPSDHPRYGESLAQEGDCLGFLAPLRGREQTDLEESILFFEAARRSLSSGRPQYGQSFVLQGDRLRSLAPLRGQQQRDLEEAISCYEAARNVLPSSDPNYGGSFIRHGECLRLLASLRGQRQKDLEKAILCYEAARNVLPSANSDYGVSFVFQGDCLRLLAPLRSQQRTDLEEAISCYEAARKVLPSDGPTYGLSLLLQGECLRSLAPLRGQQRTDLEEAISCFDAARKLLPSDHPNYGQSLVLQGKCLTSLAPLRGQERADLEEAIRCFEAARGCLENDSNNLRLLSLYEAEARQSLASISNGTSPQWILAAVCWSTITSLTSDPKELTRALENYSYCREQFQLPDAEKEMLLAAVHILDQSGSAIERARARLGDLRSRAHLFESHADYFSLGVELCLELAQRPGGLDVIQNFRNHAWDWANFGRQRNFIENLRHQNSPEISTIKVVPPLETTPDPGQLQTEYAQIKRELLTKLSSGIDVTELSEKLENLELQIGQFRSRQQSKTKNVTSPPAPPPSPVSRVVELPKLEKILSTARDCFSSKSDSQRPLLVDFMTLSSEECVVFIAPLWCEQDPVVMRLPISWSELLHWRREWMLAIHRVRRTLQRRTRKRGDLRLRSSSSSGEQQAAIADAEDRMKRALSEISRMFEPLFDRVFSEAWNPTELIFCPHFLLHTFPLHALVWQGKPLIDHFAIRYLPTPAAIPKLLTRQISATGTALLVGNPDGSLPGAQREVAAVGARLEDSGMQTIVVTDQVSKKGIILEGISRSRVAHLATHATLSRKDFLESRIELGEESIALSEIMGIKLLDGALVYLGSCDSARMLPGRSDDMMALGQAFFLAGAGAVIGSQWLLHDGAAEVFAKLFYANWAKNGSSSISIGEAFRQAMLELKEIPRFREHFFWAPFVLMGGF